jgi:hypothetical protein
MYNVEFVLATFFKYRTKHKIFAMGKHSSLYSKSATGLQSFITLIKTTVFISYQTVLSKLLYDKLERFSLVNTYSLVSYLCVILVGHKMEYILFANILIKKVRLG